MKKLIHNLIILCLFNSVSGFAQSGMFGTNLSWSLNVIGDTLSIDGEGAMPTGVTPWSIYAEQVVHTKLSEGITTLNSTAFSNFTKMRTIDIPESLISFGSNAFLNCSSLIAITIPINLTVISATTFSGCNSLTELFFNAKKITISSALNWENLKTITIGEQVELVPFKVFGNSLNVDTVYYNATNAELDAPSTTIQRHFKSVVVGENVKIIPFRAFINCPSLTYVSIPEGVEEIGEGAFRGCASLKSVIFPNSIKKIGDDAFFECSLLESIVLPKDIVLLSNRLFDKCSLASIVLPQSVDSIGSQAFRNSKITSLFIPQSVGNIGKDAFDNNPITKLVFECANKPLCIAPTDPFSNSPLDTVFIGRDIESYYSGTDTLTINLSLTKSMTIGECVTSIGNTVLFNCKNLYNITSLAVVPPILPPNTFRNTGEDFMILVPFGSGEAYRNALVWQDFTIEEQGIQLEVNSEQVKFSWLEQQGAEGYRLRLYADKTLENEIAVYDIDAAGQLQLRSTTTENVLSFIVPYSFEAGVSFYYKLEVLGVGNSEIRSSVGEFILLGETTNITKLITEPIEAKIIVYYSISGRKLPQEPSSGFYIAVYENRKAVKIFKK